MYMYIFIHIVLYIHMKPIYICIPLRKIPNPKSQRPEPCTPRCRCACNGGYTGTGIACTPVCGDGLLMPWVPDPALSIFFSFLLLCFFYFLFQAHRRVYRFFISFVSLFLYFFFISSTSLLCLINIKLRAECYERLWAWNTSPPRNHCIFLYRVVVLRVPDARNSNPWSRYRECLIPEPEPSSRTPKSETWEAQSGMRVYLSECIYQLVLESQLPPKIVNLSFTSANEIIESTVLWGSWLSKTNW